MCGIAGIMTADGAAPAAALLDRLAAALAHRGPDGEGRHVAGTVGLVHRRLAIIDLETGNQPLIAARGGGAAAALVANGEIYNYVELRADMANTRFATHSDCEPALHLYLAHGETFARRLRGMYAIAIHETAQGGRCERLVLARDPFGIKPLVYAETPAGFAFASEPQALVAAGLVAPELDRTARDEILAARFSTGRHTPFRGIVRVLPGETVIVEGGRVIDRLRREALPEGPPHPWDEAEALARLDAALRDSVAVHQRSDVPYGMFLSGGVDSSAVLALMRELNAEPVRAFAVGFEAPGVADEREHAGAVAAAAGARFESVAFGEADFWHLAPHVAAAVDDASADYAVLPTYKLASLAHEAGLKVILTGEGGDEIFAGYGRYRRAMRPRFLGGRPMRARATLEGLGVLRDEGRDWHLGIQASEAGAARHERTRLQTLQAADCADWLPNDLLTKLDRCLMAFGVEGRTPFLDPVVSEAAFRLGDRLKVRRGQGKWLLRRWLENRLPEARPFSRKRGFTVPVAAWIAARGAQLGPLVAAQPGVGEVCRSEAVRALFARVDHRLGQAAWVLLFYALWHRRHILGKLPAGDVFETLAERA